MADSERAVSNTRTKGEEKEEKEKPDGLTTK